MKRDAWILIAWLCASMLLAQHNVNYDEEKVPKYVLPELLQLQNGEKVTSVEQWEKQRRPENHGAVCIGGVRANTNGSN